MMNSMIKENGLNFKELEKNIFCMDLSDRSGVYQRLPGAL